MLCAEFMCYCLSCSGQLSCSGRVKGLPVVYRFLLVQKLTEGFKRPPFTESAIVRTRFVKKGFYAYSTVLLSYRQQQYSCTIGTQACAVGQHRQLDCLRMCTADMTAHGHFACDCMPSTHAFPASCKATSIMQSCQDTSATLRVQAQNK